MDHRVFALRALQLGEASRVAPIDKSSVLFAIVFAAVLLKERLTWQHAVGGLFIVAGALILAWDWYRFGLNDPARRTEFLRAGRLDASVVT